MGIIVQKYGGSSVSTPAKLRAVAQRVVDTRRQGHHVVVVVSAMGNTTNQLLELAHEVSPEPHRRELDMLLTVGERISMSLLSMAIQDLGAPAVSFTGSQSGIITNDTHTNARITKVVPTRVRSALDADKVVIIAGFQGVSDRLEITSLGRGGSDTTAVAMAAALNADYVEICSDVDGVYSADPRLTSHARRVDELNYDEMQILADSGAKVLNAEAVEWAKRSGVEVRCVSTHDQSRAGTSIRAALKDPHQGHSHPLLSAVTHHPGLLRVVGRGELPSGLSKCLKRYGAVDVEVHQSHLFTAEMSSGQSSSWECWISLLNLHQREQLVHALQALGAQHIEDAWSWVTLVGRSLLGMTSTAISEEALNEPSQGDVKSNPSKREVHDTTQGYDLVEQVEELLKSAELNARPFSFTSSALRWAIPLHQAPQAVRLLQERIISTQSRTHLT